LISVDDTRAAKPSVNRLSVRAEPGPSGREATPMVGISLFVRRARFW